MPSLTKDFIKTLLNLDPNNITYNIFVETGTFMGQTIFELESVFSKLYTIELDLILYEQAVKTYMYISLERKIRFIHGDSSIRLEELIMEELNDNSIFFLDGHWSCGNTSRGNKDCPLIEECEIIAENFKYNAIIVIDDYRLFGTNNICDWSAITKNKIDEIFQKRIVKQTFLPSEFFSLTASYVSTKYFTPSCICAIGLQPSVA